MATASLARTIAAALQMSVYEVEAAQGGVANWRELLVSHLLRGKRMPLVRELPPRIWQRFESLRHFGPSTAGGPGNPFTRAQGRQPPNDPDIGKFIRTPASTNVFGFQWVPGLTPSHNYSTQLGQFYVTFLAHHVSNTVKGHVMLGRSWSREQDIGTNGKTVGGKKVNKHGEGRGQTYEYDDVPYNVFRSFAKVRNNGNQHTPGVHSPGTAVWEDLRILGTIHGSQYSYRVYEGQINPDGGKYISRMATAQGLRARSVSEGPGSRGFQTSTLAERMYSSRRPRP